jgi:hypothetical protein
MLSSHIGENANVGASQECQICLNGMISRDFSDGGLYSIRLAFLRYIAIAVQGKTEIVYQEYTIVKINTQTES